MNPEHELWRNLTLIQAWPEFLREKRQESGERIPLANYQQYFQTLQPAFAHLQLRDIRIGHILDYRNARLRAAGPGLINFELYTLQQILDRAGLWAEIAQFYKPLLIPRNKPGQVFLPEEGLHRRMWRTHLIHGKRTPKPFPRPGS